MLSKSDIPNRPHGMGTFGRVGLGLTMIWCRMSHMNPLNARLPNIGTKLKILKRSVMLKARMTIGQLICCSIRSIGFCSRHTWVVSPGGRINFILSSYDARNKEGWSMRSTSNWTRWATSYVIRRPVTVPSYFDANSSTEGPNSRDFLTLAVFYCISDLTEIKSQRTSLRITLRLV